MDSPTDAYCFTTAKRPLTALFANDTTILSALSNSKSTSEQPQGILNKKSRIRYFERLIKLVGVLSVGFYLITTIFTSYKFTRRTVNN